MHPHRLLRSLPIALSLLSVACGPRDPGPHETEHGDIIYWRATGSDVSWGETCTDAEAFRGDIAPPEFEPNSYLIYKVSDDGSEAIAQDCTTLDGDSCVDSETGIVFTIAGNTLTWDPDPQVRDLAGSDCDLEADELWTLVDEGETLSWTTDISFGLVGDAATCDALQTQVQTDAPNGQGLDGCVVTLSIDTEFDQTEPG